MRRYLTSIINKSNGKVVICFSLFALLLVSTLFASPASGIRLTYVKHLFDITHNFSQPSDVSVSKDGLIYVLDGVNNKVKVFNKEGKFIFSFGKKGSTNGRFNFPMGIDIDDTGKIYVADSGNHRVQIFNPTGRFIAKIDVPPRIKEADPTDVAVNDDSKMLYVADNDNHHIVVYDLTDRELYQTIGGPGIDIREFRYPFMLALSRENYLLVTDVVNTRVHEYNPEGLFVTFIGGWGVEKGNFFRPDGVAVDNDNRMFVSDGYMGVIQVFKNGLFHSAIGDPSKKSIIKFIKPMGMFIDDNNRLYVVEMFADRVSVYQIEGDSY